MPHPTLHSLALIAAIATCAHADPATLQVSAKAPDGSPLNNIVLDAYATGSQVVAVTDEKGMATIRLDVPATDITMTIEITGGAALNADRATQAMLSNRLVALVEQFYLPRITQVPVQAGVAEYEVTIAAQPGATIHGALVLPKDASVAPPCAVWGAWSAYSPKVQGPQNTLEFQLRGAPFGEDLVLIVGCEIAPGGAGSILLIPAQQVQPDGAVGSVDVPPLPPADCSPRFQLTDNLAQWQAMAGIGDDGLWGLLLISEDGSRMYNCAAGSQTDLMCDPMPVAAGSYYIVPGVFTLCREQLLMLNALRKGQDLSNTNIPRITLAAGFDGVIQLDLVQAEHAIRAAFGLE